MVGPAPPARLQRTNFVVLAFQTSKLLDRDGHLPLHNFLFSLSSSSKSVPVTHVQYQAAAIVATLNSALSTKIHCSSFIDFKVLKSVQSALSDLLTTSATHGTFSRPSTKRGLILIGLELNTSARESVEH